MARSLRTAFLTALAVALLTGCGNSKKGSAPTTLSVSRSTVQATAQEVPTIAAQRAAYLRIVTPFNAKLHALQGPTGDFSKASTRGRAARLLRQVDWKLLNGRWSSSVRADIKETVRLDAALIADLRANDGDAWTRDVETLGAQVNIVRSDLGLPPAPK